MPRSTHSNTNTSTRRRRTEPAPPKKTLGSLIIKQLMAAVICAAVLCGMNVCGNKYINNCAAAFGRALRFDMDLQHAAQSAGAWLRDRIPQTGEHGKQDEHDANSNTVPPSGAGQITFQ